MFYFMIWGFQQMAARHCKGYVQAVSDSGL